MKRIICLLLLIVLVFTGCSEIKKQELEQLNVEISELKNEKKTIEKDIVSLKNERTDIKIEKGVEDYFITIEIGQKHNTFDFEKQVKDENNKITIEVPTTKEYFKSVEVGTVLDNSFRMGSYITSGSVGRWNIEIVGKDIR